jgi:hypothetical protein
VLKLRMRKQLSSISLPRYIPLNVHVCSRWLVVYLPVMLCCVFYRMLVLHVRLWNYLIRHYIAYMQPELLISNVNSATRKISTDCSRKTQYHGVRNSKSIPRFCIQLYCFLKLILCLYKLNFNRLSPNCSPPTRRYNRDERTFHNLKKKKS